MDTEELELKLGQFSPSPERHQHASEIMYTDGILYVIEKLEMDQLIVAIATH